MTCRAFILKVDYLEILFSPGTGDHGPGEQNMLENAEKSRTGHMFTKLTELALEPNFSV